jgi:hypothetical protein
MVKISKANINYSYGKYKLTLSIGFHGADQEDEIDCADYFTEDEWYGLTDEQRETFLYEECEESLGQSIEYGWERVK